MILDLFREIPLKERHLFIMGNALRYAVMIYNTREVSYQG